jgi:NAD-reducing hydrogenase small subunit
MDRVRLATIWLGGCSGCHMSFLDLDEFLIDLADIVDVVYGPVVDPKEYPDNVDICLIEGAVCSDEHIHHVKNIRAKTKIVVAFGDCAVTGNVPAMRNPLGKVGSILQEIYCDRPDAQGQMPGEKGLMPVLIDTVVPVHQVIKVDAFLPGCPPPASRIKEFVQLALSGAELKLQGSGLKPG